MNCLSDQNIQKCIDKELSKTEAVQIDKHLKNCKSCRDKIAKQAQFVNTLISEYNAEVSDMAIPPFQYPEVQVRSNHTKIRRLFWPAAAAMIIFFLFIYSPEKESSSANIQEAFILDIDYEIDANKPWDAQEFQFRISEQALE